MKDATKQDPFDALKTLIRTMIPYNIYRIQRGGKGLYPPYDLLEADREPLSMMYKQFEKTWVESYEENPYAIISNGQAVTGVNSEITIHVNNVENIVNVTYSIQTAEDQLPITYPIQLEMQVKIDHPLTNGILYMETISEIENLETIHEGTIIRLSPKYTALPQMWNDIRKGMKQHMQHAYVEQWIEKNEYNYWDKAIADRRLMLYVRDEEALNFPSVVIFSGELAQDGRNVRNRATATLMEPAFTFRHDRYEPFETIV